MTERRDELLDALADHVLASGLEGTSFRTLAAAAGVRHNTLTHHFGSRSELLALVFERIARRMSAPTPGAARATDAARVKDTWTRLTSPPFASLWPAFFEVLGAALRRPEQHEEFLRHVTQDWTTPLAEELVAGGRPRREALATATFVVATMRGLVIDAVSGGDPRRIRDALGLLSTFVEDQGARPGHP